jgi:hypothetical protein
MDENNRGSFGGVGVVDKPYVFDPFLPPPASPPSPAPARKSSVIDFVVKDDGDFMAGPGEFAPIPKTLMKFNVDIHGPALFFVQAVFAWTGYASRNDHLALLIDSAVYPLTETETMTDGPGIGIFKFGGPCQWAMNLAVGEHSVQILLRGGKDEGDIKVGLSVPSKIKASHRCPLVLSVIHG